MNRSIRSLLLVGVLILSISVPGQTVQAQGLSFPAEMNKSFSPISILPGGTSRLSVTIYNPNVFQLTNAAWTDNLIGVQPGLSIASPVNLTNTCGGTVTAVAGSTTLSLSGGTVPAQVGTTPGSCTVSIDVTSTTSGNLINTIPAGALSSTGGGGTITNTTPASATLRVGSVQAPSVSKSFSPNTILIGETSRLTIRIRNNDLTTALTQTSLTDQLPTNVVLANPVAPTLSNCGASASLTAVPGGTSIILANSTIAANTTCTIRVNVTSTVSGVYVNTIPADAVDNQQGVSNGSPASSTLNVQEVGISKAFSPANFQAGGTTTLTITLENPSSSPYTGVAISDTLPGTVLTVVPGSATTTCGGTASTTLPRTVSLTGGTIPAGTPANPGTCTITVQVTASANASTDTFTNTIPIGELQTDQNVTNIVPATAPVRVYQVGTGMTGSKSFSPDTILAGENSRLRINLTAPADTDLTNFSITDQLPPGVTVSNSSPATASASCGASAVLTAVTGATSISLTNGTIPAGATCQIDVYVTGSIAGVHTNTIQPTDIANNENRTVPNPLTDDLTVQVLTDFSISKAFTPPTVSPGGISTLTITLQNTNTSPLINASVTDDLPGTPTNGIIVAPTPNASTTCTGGVVTAVAGTQTISMTGGTVPAQVGNVPGTCTISVDVQGMGSLTTRTNTIPITNASATIQSTSTSISPGQPASANLIIGNLAIGVVKGFNPLTVFGSSVSTLSVELVNSNAVALTGIAFTDTMPSGMIIANPANLAVGSCGGTLSGIPGNGTFSLSGASLQAGSSCTLTLSVTITVNGNLTNTLPAGAVTTLNGASNPDPAEATLTNLPGASVSKFFTPNPVPAGDHALLTIRIQNTGGVALSGMGLTDTLPAGLEVLDSPAPVNDCSGTLTAAGGTRTIRLSNGALVANSSCSMVVSVTAGTTGSYANTIEAGSLTNDQNATNHEVATDTLVVTNSVIGGGGTGGGGGGSGGTGTGDSTPVSGTRAFIIPLTGFAPDVVTPLEPAAGPQYDATTLSLEIPFLKIDTSVVGVPMKDGAWDVSWLYDQVGWLNGTAYPTWDGNSLLTAHVVKADGQPGPFYNLKYLSVGEYIFIYHGAYRYTYQVLSNTLVHPSDASVIRHEEKSYLTLVTCDAYDEKTGTYLRRVAVRAKLVDVREVQ
ncbi:MAG TPA: sortase [Anaerolineales bacterium]|nr:sortase [Anaerolineales bacterium]